MTEFDDLYVRMVQRIECKSAEDFVDSISPRGSYFGIHQRNEWIFRGHSDSSYQLLPDSLRPNRLQELYPAAFHDLAESLLPGKSGQLYAEVQILRDFMRSCDLVGLPVPGASPSLDECLQKAQGAEAEWPQPELWPALALARHHGLPTRLLDWSRSSFSAAFFAAKKLLEFESIHDVPTERDISVWALNTRSLMDVTPALKPGCNLVSIIRTPRSDNQRLHAQEGLFTLCRKFSWGDGDIEPASRYSDTSPLDLYIINGLKSQASGFPIPDPPILREFRLPLRQCLGVLELLAKEGVTWSRLMPGYDSVVQDLLDAQRRQELNHNCGS